MSNTAEQLGIELLKSIDFISCLNSGGCLYACLGVFKALEKAGYNNENIVIVQFERGNNTFTIEENKKFIEGLNKKVYSSSHFGLSFDGGKTAYDSDGINLMGNYPLHLIIPNSMIERFCENALTYGAWNWMFNKIEGVSQINRTLNTNLKVY